MTILVLNAGSSSISFSLWRGVGEELVPGALGKIEAIAGEELLERAPGATRAVTAVGHRVVHGGAAFAGTVCIQTLLYDRRAEWARALQPKPRCTGRARNSPAEIPERGGVRHEEAQGRVGPPAHCLGFVGGGRAA